MKTVTNETTTTNIKETMVHTLVALENAEFSSKDLFNQNRDYLSSLVDINVGVRALKALVVEVTADYTSYYKNKLNTIINYSVISCSSKLSIDTNILYWYNVEKALKLVEHISLNFKEDLGLIRNLLNSLKGKSISKVTSRPDKNKYNELYSAKLVELYKEYKLDEDDDKKGVKIEALFNTLSIDSKKSMITKLQKLLK